jgi:hypothetical protein
MQLVRVSRSVVLHSLALFGVLFFIYPTGIRAQTATSGTISGVVTDPSGAAVSNAPVSIADPISGYMRMATTGAMGDFTFGNVPFNSYHLTITAPGFTNYTQDVNVRSAVEVKLAIALKLGTTSANVTVTENAADILEVEPTAHTDVDRELFDRLPLESASSSVSSLITLASPGIVADSNGLFHGLGDHAENSFSVDGQPITDQQSKVFSNQIPEDAIQSMEVISGAPPAEYGGKTSVVVKVTTRSGLGITQPTGSVTTSYGSFGTGNVDFNLAVGGPKWGNFIAGNGLQTSRFLDPPQFVAIHDKGNEENFFDRADYKVSAADTLQLNLQYTHSWFQTPDSLDQLNEGSTDPAGNLVGIADQRSEIKTINIAPSWTRVIGTSAVFSLGAFLRQDQYTYFPSANPFADFTNTSDPLQQESVAQSRKLTNTGIHPNISYVKGIHNLQAGITYEQTFLTEHDSFGVLDPTVNSPCLNGAGDPVATDLTAPSQCGSQGLDPNSTPNPMAGSVAPIFSSLLACYDLSRPVPAAPCPNGATNSTAFDFPVHTDVKEFAVYVEDTITKGGWNFNLGLRGDMYNGFASAGQAEPRLGAAYKIKQTNTVLRLSYAHTMESPFNENLILSSNGCDYPAIAALFEATSNTVCTGAPLTPGYRNEYHAGLQQAFGKYFVLDGEYIWKYTRNAYDFSVLGNTPITFPIEWAHSKIPGFTVHGTLTSFHGLSAFIVLAHVSARFFNPQESGLGATPGGPEGAVFRIDHDENLEQTTHVQYQPFKRGPWFGFNWRYDSGMVVSGVPDVAAALKLTGNEQATIGFACNGVAATPQNPITVCNGIGTSTLITLPQTGTENDDHNPDRVKPRSLLDFASGDDDLFHTDRYKWSLRFTVVNLTDKIALYNFLSTFSGTHFVTPRSETVELGFHF